MKESMANFNADKAWIDRVADVMGFGCQQLLLFPQNRTTLLSCDTQCKIQELVATITQLNFSSVYAYVGYHQHFSLLLSIPLRVLLHW